MDLIIDDADKPVKNKKEEITKLIATICQEMEEQEFSDIASQQVTTLNDYFKGKVNAHLPKIHEDITQGSDLVLNKTRGNYGEGLVHSILQRNWSIIPTSMP